MSELPILDHDTIENLRLLGDDEGDDSFLREVIEIFVEDTPRRIAEMRQALAEGDIEVLARGAHSIKGSSANVGALRLNALAGKLEQDAHDPSADTAPQIEALAAAFAEARIALDKL